MLSLCMIARDEEAMIRQCLASVSGLVDEMVVVDTGSSDGTVAVAESMGAAVSRFQWNDNFSDARNRALDLASGDWILILDADEVLVPGGFDAIRSFIKENRCGVGLLPLHNAASLEASQQDVLSGRLRLGEPVRLPRLVKRTPTLTWTGMFHEHFGDWMLKEQIKFENVDAPLVHYGNVPELRKALGKEARNERILKAYCSEEPDNLRAWSNYLKVLLRTDRIEDIRCVADTTWDILLKQIDSGAMQDTIGITMVACQRAEFLKSRGELKEALACLELALKLGFKDSSLYLIMGTVLEQTAIPLVGQKRTDMLQQARDSYLTCLTFHGKISQMDTYPGSTSWAAYLRLGYTFLRLHQFKEARQHFENALKTLPNLDFPHIASTRTEAVVGKLAALTDGGQGTEALSQAREHLRHLQGPDMWAMAADAAEQTGQFKIWTSMFRRATSHLQKQPFVTALAKKRYIELLELLNIYRGIWSLGTGSLGLLGGILAGESSLKDLEDISPNDKERLRRVLNFLNQDNPLLLNQAMEKGHSSAPKFIAILRSLLNSM